jgi:PPOX class probable F420-dependent enzyme
MSVAEWLADSSSRFYLRIRHPDAWDTESASDGTFDGLRGHKYALLQTFRKSGEAIPTPVWFGLADGKLFFRSYADAVKLKRIRNNPRVLVGPCDVRGKPKGKLIEGRARVLSEAEEGRAEEAIKANYGLFRRVYEGSFAMSVDGTYVEVEPA